MVNFENYQERYDLYSTQTCKIQEVKLFFTPTSLLFTLPAEVPNYPVARSQSPGGHPGSSVQTVHSEASSLLLSISCLAQPVALEAAH